MLDADSDALVMGLVWAHLQSNPEALLAWVSPYTQVRYMGYSRGFSLVHVAGHYRQKTVLASAANAIRAVCKFERVVAPHRYCVRPSRPRRRRRADGSLISRAMRDEQF